jgi:hypothetical protein
MVANHRGSQYQGVDSAERSGAGSGLRRDSPWIPRAWGCIDTPRRRQVNMTGSCLGLPDGFLPIGRKQLLIALPAGRTTAWRRIGLLQEEQRRQRRITADFPMPTYRSIRDRKKSHRAIFMFAKPPAEPCKSGGFARCATTRPQPRRLGPANSASPRRPAFKPPQRLPRPFLEPIHG